MCFNEAAGIPRGRHTVETPDLAEPEPASMRPRVFPAADKNLAVVGDDPVIASMRPRVFPAEDLRGGVAV